MNFDHLIGQTVGTARLLKKLDHGVMSIVFLKILHVFLRLTASPRIDLEPDII
jgi:hypothetical protein